MTSITSTFPGVQWERIAPGDAGMNAVKLEEAKRRLVRDAEGSGDSRYQVVIVRGGRLVAEWGSGLRREEQLRMASATKSIFSSILGIAIEDGRIESADSRLIDYYPEAMDVPEDAGPKSGRHVFPKDRDITLRQLISNTLGCMKPGEEPGRVFHYQTFVMNALIHATAKAYELYDPSKSEESAIVA